MSQPGREFTPTLESCWERALPALHRARNAIGATAAGVLLLKETGDIGLLYTWPEPFEPGVDTASPDLRCALEGASRSVPAGSPVADLLRQVCRSAASFLLFRCGMGPLTVVVVFGFTGSLPPRDELTDPVADEIQLASLTIWCVQEIRRLRTELAVVAERLGKRKLIERAKGLLQAEHGFDEQQAYEHLRRLSRQRRKRMTDIAKDLIGTSLSP